MNKETINTYLIMFLLLSSLSGIITLSNLSKTGLKTNIKSVESVKSYKGESTVKLNSKTNTQVHAKAKANTKTKTISKAKTNSKSNTKSSTTVKAVKSKQGPFDYMPDASSNESNRVTQAPSSSFTTAPTQSTTTQPTTTQPTTTQPTTTQNVDYFNARVTNCNNRNCFPLNGVCTSTTNCKCLKGKANYPVIGTETESCTYEQKKQLTAFLLEFFLSAGIGHFYRGLWWLGLIKLFVLIILPILFCSLMCCIDSFKAACCLMSILFPIMIGIWWLIDIILFGINYYPDGNGVPLEAW